MVLLEFLHLKRCEVNMKDTLSENELIFIKFVIDKIDNIKWKSFIIKLLNESTVIGREYSNYGMYIDFNQKNIINIKEIPIDIPVLFSAYLDLPELGNGAFFMFYLREDRTGLNFLEISMGMSGFDEDYMARKIYFKH